MFSALQLGKYRYSAIFASLILEYLDPDPRQCFDRVDSNAGSSDCKPLSTSVTWGRGVEGGSWGLG